VSDLEPLAVYDVRDGSYDGEKHGKFRAWCGRQGIDVDITVRVEIHKTGHLFARVTEHDLDEKGQAVVNDAGTDIRMRTRDVPVSCHPPQRPTPVKPAHLAKLVCAGCGEDWPCEHAPRDGRCKATTSTGKPCRRWADPLDGGHCRMHWNWEAR
jgi:hypothetical protein